MPPVNTLASNKFKTAPVGCGFPVLNAIGSRKWREGKVRPVPGNSPHDRLLTWAGFSIVEGEFATIPSSPLAPCSLWIRRRHRMRFFQAWRNLSGPMWSENLN
jgi:hypothetical protein